MSKFENLLIDYKDDPLISKIEEAYHKWRNHNNHKKIVRRQKNIYWLDIDDKFIKFPNLICECLTEINFKAKDCFKVYFIIYKNLQRSGKPYITCHKSYLLKQIKINRLYLNVCLKELEEKNMLLVDKLTRKFQFTLNVAPLLWILSERERENIEKEVEREVERINDKWIEENLFFE